MKYAGFLFLALSLSLTGFESKAIDVVYEPASRCAQDILGDVVITLHSDTLGLKLTDAFGSPISLQKCVEYGAPSYPGDDGCLRRVPEGWSSLGTIAIGAMTLDRANAKAGQKPLASASLFVVAEASSPTGAPPASSEGQIAKIHGGAAAYVLTPDLFLFSQGGPGHSNLEIKGQNVLETATVKIQNGHGDLGAALRSEVIQSIGDSNSSLWFALKGCGNEVEFRRAK